MKKTTRLLSLLLVLVLCLSVLPVGAAAASSGWQKSGDYWYYYQNGSPVTGWKQISGAWYYFVADDSVMDIHSYPYGAMAYSDWLEEDGDWYYFGSNGKMVTSQWVKDPWTDVEGTTHYSWYYQLSSGKGAMGWQKIGGVWYYFDPDWGGEMVTGFQEIKGAYYYFKDSGALFTGWKKLPFSDEDGNEWESWVYFTSNGAVENGWKKIGGKWYYFIDYEMMADWWVDEDDGDSYRLGSDGAMVTSKWVYDNGDWFYQLSSGKSAKGWLKLGGVWYYFDPDDYGAMVAGGLKEINGSYYYFKDSGALYTGWKQLPYYDEDGNIAGYFWAYFTSNGAVESGWKQINGKWYQFADYICLNP